MFVLEFTKTAMDQEAAVKKSSNEGLKKQVLKTLGYLQTNPRHPSLSTHEYHSLPHPTKPGEKVFEAYIQNKTPSAYRVFFVYGSAKKIPTPGRVITIIAITPHP